MTILHQIPVALLLGLVTGCGEVPQPVASDRVELESETSPELTRKSNSSLLEEPSGASAANPIATPKGMAPLRFQINRKPLGADWNLMWLHRREMQLMGVEVSLGIKSTGMFRVTDRAKFRSEVMVTALQNRGLLQVSITDASSGYYLLRAQAFG